MKHSQGSYDKYRKDISHLSVLDVYRVLDLFGVTDHAIGHAIKKLLMSGQRTGNKTAEKDINEAIDTLIRKHDMLLEDERCDVNIGTVDGATLRQTQTLMPEQALVMNPTPAYQTLEEQK